MMWYNKVMIKRAGIIGGIIVATMISCALNVNAAEEETDFVVEVEPMTMLTVPSSPVILSIAPTAEGVYDSTSFDVIASTNSKKGYTLSLEVDNTYLESAPNSSTGITNKVQAIPLSENGISAETFSATTDTNILNHWGIAFNNNNFNQIKKNQEIRTATSRVSNDKTTITLGAKVTTDTAPGNYSTTLNFKVVTNIDKGSKGTTGGDPKKPSKRDGGKGFDGGTLGRAYEVYYNEVLEKSIYVRDDSTPEGYHLLQDEESTGGKEVYFAMQDMSPTICEWTTVVPDHLQVMDLRDAKVYWISKLADGKCWMTQNLDLDLNSNITLTPEDTDIRENWKPMISTLNAWEYGRSWVDDNYSNISDFWNDVATSVDVGDWYWIGNWMNNGVSTWYSGTTNNVFYPGSQDVGSNPVKFQITPFQGNGEHGHMGNYYNWPAAVAKNVLAGYSGGSFDTSICPAHWRLPTSEGQYQNYDNDGNGDFAKLLRAYGGDASNDKIWTAEPLYFVRGGEAGYSSDNPTETGYRGYYWTGSKTSGHSSYYLYFGDSSIYPSSTSDWRFTMNIRCVAR